MELRLQRFPSNEYRTHGDIYDNATWLVFTLEDCVRIDNPLTVEDEGAKVPTRTAIPAGRYRLTLENSPRFGLDTITLTDPCWETPGDVGLAPDGKPLFTSIRVHGGNDEKDTEGCILVGTKRNLNAAVKPFIWNCQPALNQLRKIVQEQTKLGEEVWLKVKNND